MDDSEEDALRERGVFFVGVGLRYARPRGSPARELSHSRLRWGQKLGNGVLGPIQRKVPRDDYRLSIVYDRPARCDPCGCLQVGKQSPRASSSIRPPRSGATARPPLNRSSRPPLGAPSIAGAASQQGLQPKREHPNGFAGDFRDMCSVRELPALSDEGKMPPHRREDEGKMPTHRREDEGKMPPHRREDEGKRPTHRTMRAPKHATQVGGRRGRSGVRIRAARAS
jgi:hypothetical protein